MPVSGICAIVLWFPQFVHWPYFCLSSWNSERKSSSHFCPLQQVSTYCQIAQRGIYSRGGDLQALQNHLIKVVRVQLNYARAIGVPSCDSASQCNSPDSSHVWGNCGIGRVSPISVDQLFHHACSTIWYPGTVRHSPIRWRTCIATVDCPAAMSALSDLAIMNLKPIQ